MLYSFDTFTLDTQRYELRHAGQPVPLEPQVFKVLAYLVQHADRVVPREELFERLWPGQYVSDDALGRCIRKARQVFGEQREVPRFIKTLPRHGYHFIAPVTVHTSEALASDTLPAVPSLSSTVDTPPVVCNEEYKQVTVLCGVVRAVSAVHTPMAHETRYRMLQACYAALHDLVHQYAGTVLMFGDEGFQALFGAPMAQEDHARRAVIVALEFQQALRGLYTTLTPLLATELTVCMGVHTGVVVVGHLGDVVPQPYTVVGDTITIATQLRDMAAAGTLLIGDTTARFVEGIVHVEPHGTVEVATLPALLSVWRVAHRLPARPAGFGRGMRTLSRFVGRARELAILHERLERAVGGHGQAIAIAGEPGIGKSRLLSEFQRSLPGRPWRYYAGHCRSYSSGTPYLPVLELLRQLCGIAEADTPDRSSATIHQVLQPLDMLSDEHTPYLLHLLGCPSAMADLTHLSPQARRACTFASLRQLMLRLSRHHPLVLAVENLHWIDATSDEFLAALVDSLGGASLVLVVTYRSGYRPAWLDKSYATQLALPGLDAQESLAIVQSVPQTARIPITVQQAIVQTAGGNPFFLEELAWAFVEQGGDACSPAVPATVQAVLAARIDRLAPAAKRLLQTAAVIGPAVPLGLLAALADDANNAELLQNLEQLQSAEFLYETQVGAEQLYMFKHALTQDVAYGSLLLTRRQTLHARVAQVLTTQYPETMATQPELLAHHYTEAGHRAQAIGYWHRAAAHAIQRSAYVEALRHLSTARALLTTLPKTRQRAQLELDVLMLLGPVYMATQGYGSPEVHHTYTRARALCHQLGETPQTLPVLLELLRLECVRAQHTTALALGQQCLTLAHRHPDPRLLLEAHGRLGFTLSLLGDLRAAQTHLEHALALSQAQSPSTCEATQDPGVACLSFLAWTLVPLGYQDHALVCMRQAVARAHALAHPFSLVFATHHAGIIHHLRREPQAAYASAETSLHMARTHGFPLFVGANLVLQGWALAMHGQTTEALAQMEQGLTMSRATGHRVFYPWNLALMAEAYGQAGQFAAALTVVAEALTVVDTTEERMWEAELHRLKGEVCLAQTAENHAVAEACLQQALVVARRQHAKSWELRATMSLARLWQCQGKRAEASELLAPIYGWFTEGFDTPDLQDARVLLDALEG